MKHLLCLFICAICLPAFCQDSTITHQFESKAFDKTRTIHVYLPERYQDNPQDTFMVTYVLDGQYSPFLDAVTHSINYMVQNYTIIPTIVVGIASDNRGTEFTPPAQELTQSIKQEIIPYIESNYRVNRFRALIGHSWGGMMVANTLFSEHRDLFNGYIAISPSMGYNDGFIFARADSLLKSAAGFRQFYYASSGDIGNREAEFGGQVKKMDGIIQLHQHPGLAWKKNLFENTGHWSCVIPSLSDGMLSMSRTFWFDQDAMEDHVANSKADLFETIDAFNQKTKERFGYVHITPKKYYKFVANDFSEQGKQDVAEQIRTKLKL